MEYGKGATTVTADEGGGQSGSLKKANIFYAFIFLLMAIICFILYNAGGQWPWIQKVIGVTFNADSMYGVAAVLRVTAALAVFFAIHGLITIGTPNLTDSLQFLIHSSYMWAHFLVLVLLIVGAFALPEGFYDFWIYFAWILSGLYLIFQALMLIVWFDQLNNQFGEEDNLVLGFVITGVLALVCVGGWIMSFIMFVQYKNEPCTRNVWVILVNLIGGVVLFIFGWFSDHGSGLVSIMVVAYSLFNMCCGLMCSTICNKNDPSPVFTIVGSVFTLGWMTYSAFSASNNIKYFDCCDDDDATPSEEKYSLSFFHFCFSLASIYLGMLVTNWGKQDDVSIPWSTNRGVMARWVNFIVSWIVVLFYGWVIVAPYVCKGREFDY